MSVENVTPSQPQPGGQSIKATTTVRLRCGTNSHVDPNDPSCFVDRVDGKYGACVARIYGIEGLERRRVAEMIVEAWNAYYGGE